MRCRRLVNQQRRSINYFCDIVRRDAGRHTHGNAACPICEQIGEKPRHNLGLFIFAIISWTEISGIFVQTIHQLDSRLGQTSLGVAVCRRIIAVDIPEIPLPVDKRIAERKCLREAHHRIVDRLVTMGMIFTDDIAHNTGAFFVPLRRIKLKQPHRPQQPPVYRFQAIAQIRQGPRGDRRHRVNQIAFGQGRIKRRINDGVERVFGQCINCIGHCSPDSGGCATRKVANSAIHRFVIKRLLC